MNGNFIFHICFGIFIMVFVFIGIFAAGNKIKTNEKAMRQIELIIVEKEYQRQAVSNNFAHWEVNVNGEVTFKWNNQ